MAGTNQSLRIPGPGSVARDMESMRIELERLKSVQYGGGDNLLVEALPLITGTETLAPGATSVWSIVFTPTQPRLALSMMGVSTFVDVDNDLAYLYRLGTSLSADQKLIRRNLTLEYALSYDPGGVQYWTYEITNEGIGSKVLYHKFQLYTPRRLAGATV